MLESPSPAPRAASGRRPSIGIVLPWLVTLTLVSTLGCGPEREFSGVWRQSCGSDPGEPACGEFVYELHLGRYGDAVTGLVVRYAYDGNGFNNFQRTQECGCFLIEGGTADATDLRFRLFDAQTPRYPQPDTPDSELGCPDGVGGSLLTACPGQRFLLEGDDELVTGSTDCGAGSPRPIAFEKVVGQPRTECYARLEGVE